MYLLFSLFYFWEYSGVSNTFQSAIHCGWKWVSSWFSWWFERFGWKVEEREWRRGEGGMRGREGHYIEGQSNSRHSLDWNGFFLHSPPLLFWTTRTKRGRRAHYVQLQEAFIGFKFKSGVLITTQKSDADQLERGFSHASVLFCSFLASFFSPSFFPIFFFLFYFFFILFYRDCQTISPFRISTSCNDYPPNSAVGRFPN